MVFLYQTITIIIFSSAISLVESFRIKKKRLFQERKMMSLSAQPTAFHTLSHVLITTRGINHPSKGGNTVKGKGGDQQRERTTVHSAAKPGLSPKPAVLPLPLNGKTLFPL